MNIALLPHNKPSYIINIPLYKQSYRKIAHATGRLVGKTKNFFAKTETKITFITTYWALETALFALFLAAINNAIIAATATTLYLYGTYALYSALQALIGSK